PVETRSLKLTLIQQYIHQMTIGRFRVSVTRDEGARAWGDLPPEVEAVLAREPRDESRGLEAGGGSSQSILVRQFLSIAPELAEANKRIAELQKSMPRFVRTMVFEERRPAVARVTRRHHRGEFLDEREEVATGVPACLHPMRVAANDAAGRAPQAE